MRTPEQVKADDALTEAINAVDAAYSNGVNVGVLTDYVVIYARQYWDDDGDQRTILGRIYRDSEVPAYRALGLSEFLASRLRDDIAIQYRDTSDDEDDD